jgi:hypothetical protein
MCHPNSRRRAGRLREVVRYNTDIGDMRVVSDHFPMESDQQGDLINV